MARNLAITIGHDPDVESPAEHDGAWKLYSFNRRHSAFKHPDHFFTANRKPKSFLGNKMRVGLAFILGYYEHGNCQWALSGEQWPCQWDSVDVAGVLVWEESASNMGAKTKEARADDARNFLKEYTAWCNGEGCYFSIEIDGEPGDSCGGFLDMDYMFDVIAESVKPGDKWTFPNGDVAFEYERKLEKAANAA